MKSHFLQIIIAVVLLFSLFNLLSKSSAGRFVIWLLLAVGLVFCVVLWMLKYRREHLARGYRNPYARHVIDFVCKVSGEQPPVDIADSANNAAEKDLLLQSPSDFYEMSAHITERVRGFETVVSDISSHLDSAIAIRRRASASEYLAPLGTFLLSGPAGCGKKYLAEHFGVCLYQSAKVFTFDLRDVEPFDFLGSSAAENSLLAAVTSAPRCTVILENISSSDPRILEFLQQHVFTRGAVEDSSKNRIVSFRETLFFLIQEIDQTSAESADMHSIGAVSTATGLPHSLLQTLDRVFFVPLHSSETCVEILILLMQEQCRKYQVELTYVDPKILAEGVNRFGMAGLAGAPSWVHRVLQGPLHTAASANHTTLSLAAEQADSETQNYSYQ